MVNTKYTLNNEFAQFLIENDHSRRNFHQSLFIGQIQN